jgi:hypothetical protein
MRASKVKKQLLQTKLPQLQKSKFLLRRPSRLSPPEADCPPAAPFSV